MEYRQSFPERLLRTLQLYAPYLPERVWDGIWMGLLILTIWWTPTSSSALVVVLKVVLPVSCFWAMLCAATRRVQNHRDMVQATLINVVKTTLNRAILAITGSGLTAYFLSSPGWIKVIAAVAYTLLVIIVGAAIKTLLTHVVVED